MAVNHTRSVTGFAFYFYEPKRIQKNESGFLEKWLKERPELD